MAQTFSFPNYGLFNATYYLQQNPDVATSWTGTPLQHYTQFGALEGRAPTAWFNADFYRASYTDLQSMNALQLFNHYCNYGFNEGRVPMLNFSNFNGARYLIDNPDVAAAGYTAANAISHFVSYGEYEGRVAYADNGVVIQPVVNLGQTFTLTTGVDIIDGTQFNDTFNAMLAGADATLNTLQGFDSLDGMGGADTLNAQLYANGADLSVTPRALDNIEVINVAASNNGTAGNVTLNLLNAGQVLNVANTGSTTGLTFNNIAAAADLAVQDTGGNTEFTYANTAGLQSADLALTNVTGGTQTITDVETVSVTSSGSSNDTTLAGGATRINVSGTADLDLNVLNASVRHLHAEGFEGDLTADISAQVSNTSATSVHGGLGDDDFIVTNVAIGTGTVASELNGGAGDNAIIATYTADQANVVDAGSITITNIQDVNLVAVDNSGLGAVGLGLNAALVGGLTAVGVSARDANAANIFTVTGLTSSQTVFVDQVVVGGGAQLELAGGTGVTAVNVALDAGADLLATQDVVINEATGSTALTTVNLSTDANSYGAVDFEAGEFTTINVAGGAVGETLTVGGVTAINAATFNASTFNSNLVATFGAAGQSIVGGNGDDTFNFTTNLGTTDTVDGGLGDNTVAFTLGAGLVGPHLTNVQNLDVTTTGTSNTISLQNSTGVEVIDIVATAAGTDSATFTNLDDALTDVVVSDSIGTLSVTTAAGELADVTVTIGTQGVATTSVTDATFNTRGSLTVAAVDDLLGAVTESITTTLATNATSLTFTTASDDVLDVAGTVTANSATSVAVNAATGNASVDGANSFDSLNTLAVNATLGAVATFVGTSNTAEANLTIGSVTLTTDDEASTVTNTVSLTASTAAAANLSATLGSLVITNGLDSDITSTTTLTATNTGAASITSATITNNGDAGDQITANLNFVAGATGTASVGTLNVAAVAATSDVNVNLDVGAGQTVVTIGAGALTGAGQIDVATTDLTALDLSNLDTTGFTGTLTVTGTNAALVNVVGTAYGESITFAALALASEVTGGGGSDAITLSTGSGVDNTAVYLAQSDSTGTVYDYIANFDEGVGNDLIDLSALMLGGAAFGGVTADATVTYTSGTDVTFTIAAADAVGFFGANQALAADDGAGNNATVVFVDANLSGSWEAGSDMAIVLLGVNAANLVDGNFVWA